MAPLDVVIKRESAECLQDHHEFQLYAFAEQSV